MCGLCPDLTGVPDVLHGSAAEIDGEIGVTVSILLALRESMSS